MKTLQLVIWMCDVYAHGKVDEGQDCGVYYEKAHGNIYDHVVWHRWHIESNGGDLLGLFSEV